MNGHVRGVPCGEVDRRVAAVTKLEVPIVEPDWRQEATMDADGQVQGVVGTSDCQGALRAAVAGLTGTAAETGWVMAQVVPEPANAQDPMALRVLVGVEQVGYLPANERNNNGVTAHHRWNTVMKQTTAGLAVSAPAQITGRDKSTLGIVLFSCCYAVVRPGEAVTLWGKTSFALPVGATDQEAVADKRRAQRPYPVSLVHQEGRVWVGLDGRWAGSFPSDTWGPMVDDLAAAGFVAACLAELDSASASGERCLRLRVPDLSGHYR